MKKKLILLPLFALLLTGCGGGNKPSDSSVEPPFTDTEEPPIPSVPSEDEGDEVTVKTIAELRTEYDLDAIKDNPVLVQTTGVVTKKYLAAKVNNAPAYIVTIQDGDVGLSIYGVAPDKIESFGEVGQKLTVKGYFTHYNGLRQFTDAEAVKVEDGTAVTPKTITSVKQDDLKNMDSTLVKIEGAEYISHSFGITDGSVQGGTMTVKLDGTNIDAYAHYYMPLELMEGILAKLVTEDEDGNPLAVDKLDFTGIIGMNNNTYQFSLTDPDEIDNVSYKVPEEAVYEDLFTFHEKLAAGTYNLGDIVDVKGVVTGLFPAGSFPNAGVILQQTEGTEVAGLNLFHVQKTLLEGVEVGKEVGLKGKVAEYHGMKQLSDVSTLEVLGDGAEQAHLTLTAENVDNLPAKHQNVLVDVADLQPADNFAEGITDYKTVFPFTLGGKPVAIRQNDDNPANAAVLEKLSGLKTVDRVAINGAILGWYDGPQMFVLNADDITVTTGEVPALTGIAATIEKAELGFGETAQITVTAEPAGAVLPETITFEADNEVVTVSETGLVTAGTTAGASVITVTAGEFTATVDVTVIESDEIRYTLTAADLGLTQSYLDYEGVEVNGVTWDLRQLFLSNNGEIQMRNKNGVQSAFWNTTAFPNAIKKVEIHHNAGFQTFMNYAAGTEVTTDETALTQIGDGASGHDAGIYPTPEYALEDNIRFIRIAKPDLDYTVYLPQIVVVMYA